MSSTAVDWLRYAATTQRHGKNATQAWLGPNGVEENALRELVERYGENWQRYHCLHPLGLSKRAQQLREQV